MLGLDPRAREAFPLVKLLATSGMRLAEAINITWGEIDFDKDSEEMLSKKELLRTFEICERNFMKIQKSCP